MTAPIESKIPAWWFYAAPLGAGLLRATVGTPLDAVATREILYQQTTLQVIRKMTAFDFWKGFQPNFLKFVTRTPIQFSLVKIASLLVPTDYDAAIRGIFIGVFSSGMEAATVNAWNALRTRFIQGAGWRVLYAEGPSILFKGLSSTVAHRALSGAAFWVVHETLRDKFPDHKAVVSTIAGCVQVVSTAPFYITAIYRQRKDASPEYLYRTLWHILKTQKMRGLFLPALAPRLVHSALTSAPLMWLMDKLHLVHRKN